MAVKTKKIIEETKKEEAPETKEVNELLSLREELEALKKMLKANSNTTQQIMVSPQEDDEVVLISLYDGTLSLWTENSNSGELYKFSTFGEEQPMPLAHAKGIIRNQKSFLNEGYFYIENAKLHRDKTIRDSSKNVLEKEAFVNLMSAKPKDFKSLFTNVPKGQKKVFADILVAKIVEQENVDMNIVKIVGEQVDMDLFSVAEGIKYLRKNIDK